MLTEKPGWRRLKAVKNRQVFVADGNQYFNRPGPRVVESLEILAEALHPDRFHFGHGRLPQLAEAQLHEQFRSPEEWEGAMKLAEYWLNRLGAPDKHVYYDKFTTTGSS